MTQRAAAPPVPQDSARPFEAASRLIAARALRGFGDGFVSVYLAAYLTLLGLSPGEIGVLVTAMMLGSAGLTLGVGLLGARLAPGTILLGASALMFATSLGFAACSGFWPLLLVGFAGTLNPSSGDVSVFLPTEQAVLSSHTGASQRPRLFARYNLAGALLGALGALAGGGPEWLAASVGLSPVAGYRAGFLIYGALAVASAALYWNARDWAGPAPAAAATGHARGPMRSLPIVLRLAALFSLDSFGSGLVVQSLLALWLYRRFSLSTQQAGAIFFAAGVLTAFSQLISARLAARIGLIETMVFTHLPANVFLILAAFMPSAALAVTCLLLRMALSQMDVPARQSYVMAVVPPEERTAAASLTNVPRSLAAGLSPLLAGWLLAQSDFGWTLVLAGGLKIVYDLTLLVQFRAIRPPEESG